MLSPPPFAQKDVSLLRSFMVDHPFATLLAYSNSTIEANHIPLFLHHTKGKDFLHGHIAKANPLWKNIADNSEVLVIFNGPNCYISPNYYPSKKEHGKAVPTWNYMTVHARGIIRFVFDDKWNTDMIKALTEQHESQQDSPWSIDDAPDDYIQQMLKAIVGFEIDVTSITGQWKLSQNQEKRNRMGVIAELAKNKSDKSDSDSIAELISAYTLNNE